MRYITDIHKINFAINGRLANFAVSDTLINQTVVQSQNKDTHPDLETTNPHNRIIKKRVRALENRDKADSIQKIRAYNSGIRGDDLNNPYLDRSKVIINNGYGSNGTNPLNGYGNGDNGFNWGNAANVGALALGIGGLGFGTYAMGRMRGVGRLPNSFVERPMNPSNPVNVHIQPHYTNTVEPNINPTMNNVFRDSLPRTPKASNPVPSGNPPSNPMMVDELTTMPARKGSKPTKRSDRPAAQI